MSMKTSAGLENSGTDSEESQDNNDEEDGNISCRQFLGAAAALRVLGSVPSNTATSSSEPERSEEELCADIYEEQIIPARIHLIATRGERAEPAKAELEEAVRRLEAFLEDSDA